MFGAYVVAGLGALIGAILLVVSLTKPDFMSSGRGLARDVAEPVARPAAVARTESHGVLDVVSGYWRAGRQNAALRKEMELARIRLSEAQAVRQENARLRALLGLSQRDENKPVAMTQFVGSSASSTRRFGYIGAGSADGVEAGMPVRSPRGVVGRVLETSRSSARVLLLTDSQSVLPVRLARADVAAFAEGRGDGLLRIRLINLGINPLRKGDVFVSSGTGGYFAPNMAVAIVTTVTEDGALARMVSDPAATDYVAVLPLWQAETVRVAETPIEQAVTE